jgi:hypothetical protein
MELIFFKQVAEAIKFIRVCIDWIASSYELLAASLFGADCLFRVLQTQVSRF